jgi:hypothetical protein
MTKRFDIVGGAILRGAYAKWFGRESIADNPFADFPGSYVLHKAWRYGFENSDAVLAEHDAGKRVRSDAA